MFPSCTVFDVIYSRLEVAPKLKYGSIARCGKVCLDHKPLYTIERSPTLSNRDSSVCECSSLCFTSNLCNPFLKGVLLNGSFQSCHERFQPNRGFLSYRQSPSVRGLRKLPPRLGRENLAHHPTVVEWCNTKYLSKRPGNKQSARGCNRS